MFTASIEDDFLRLNWKPGVCIEYADAVEAALALHTLRGEEPMPLLVNIVGLRGVTPKARAGMNAYRSYTKVALVGDSPMGAVLAAFSWRSRTPTRYFTSEDEAIIWLIRKSSPKQSK
ncbi:hypothetical protein IWX64_003333 [Arthrobacter sp. CAN_A212]|uniref:STAS/SEC14 domain-containing protein n=1 Tax=Arthrobacter sp. CAN_A212 TaxID=2787719 RepID=UPI0018CB2FA0